MLFVILVVLGLIVGMVGSLIGFGGGIVIVLFLMFLSIVMLLFQDVMLQVVIGILFLVIIFMGFLLILVYIKYKIVDYKSGFIFFIGLGFGSIIGVYVLKLFNLNLFFIWFGIFMIFILLFLMLKVKVWLVNKVYKGIIWIFQDDVGEFYIYLYQVFIGIVIVFVVGFLGGFFGIGGGLFMVLVMMLLFLFLLKVVVVMFMFIIFLFFMIGFVLYVIFGYVNWLYVFVFVFGVWFGGKFGVVINRKM